VVQIHSPRPCLPEKELTANEGAEERLAPHQEVDSSNPLVPTIISLSIHIVTPRFVEENRLSISSATYLTMTSQMHGQGTVAALRKALRFHAKSMVKPCSVVSQTRVAVSSTNCTSPNFSRSFANKESTTSTGVCVMASAYSRTTFSVSENSKRGSEAG
jgi:hypothetical protein